MNEVRAEALDAALASGFVPRIRLACLGLTLSSAFFLGAPILLSSLAPRPLPPLDDGAPTLDLALGFLFLLQIIGTVAMFQLQGAWQRLARQRPEPGQAWEAGPLAEAMGRAWLIRYALGEAVCVAAGLGLFLGYQQGLLPVAQRIWLLALPPLIVLAWMLTHWPDEKVLRKAFQHS